MIRFENVTKQYGETAAVKGINLEIQSEEFLFIVGRSGAGKSTLVKLLTREIFPTEGEIYFEDIPVTQLKDKYVPLLRQEIGVVFQDFKLLDSKTVEENIAFGLEVLCFKEEEIQQRVQESLELVGLLDKADHFPLQLSGGEKQRAAVARAVALSPKVLIADEPTGNVDPDLTDEMFKLFEKINKQGITVIVATHDPAEVDKMKKRVIELEKGEIVRDEKKGKYRK